MPKGNSCSSCPQDCGVCKKLIGESCDYNSDCESGYCVHNICRSSLTYCGDGYCDTGETCSNCELDCGKCKKSLGESCSYNSDCESGICLHGTCRASTIFCGDGYCDSGEYCQTCPADCGECRAMLSIIEKKIRVNDYSTYSIKYVNYTTTGEYYLDQSVSGSNVASLEVTIKNVGNIEIKNIEISASGCSAQPFTGVPISLNDDFSYDIYAYGETVINGSPHTATKIVSMPINSEAEVILYLSLLDLEPNKRYDVYCDFSFVSIDTPVSITTYVRGDYHVSVTG